MRAEFGHRRSRARVDPRRCARGTDDAGRSLYPGSVRAGRPADRRCRPSRTREKVLRIVFPSHIDASGRLYEQTAVHAVVENV
ncbi:TraV family lipoprotein, partial [Escherichia coli]|uniref:TraV family lipoprotein n=1 Tax=Escherichia coli TaxID=562 RepID=UPI0034D56724